MGYIIKDFHKSDTIPNGSIYMETIFYPNHVIRQEEIFRFLVFNKEKKSNKIKINKIKK